MEIEKYICEGRPRLLLFFCGWSASPALFHSLQSEPDQDVWLVSDYRNLTFDADLSAYQSVTLLAWSLGVWVAEQLFADESSVHWERKIAINGTGCPVHDTEGIPEAIFRGTLENLTPDGCLGSHIAATHRRDIRRAALFVSGYSDAERKAG